MDVSLKRFVRPIYVFIYISPNPQYPIESKITIYLNDHDASQQEAALVNTVTSSHLRPLQIENNECKL